MYKKIVYIFIVISIFYSSVSANKLISINEDQLLNLLPLSYMYIDYKKMETIDSIKKKKFKKINSSKHLAFGYAPDFTVWVKFTLKNDTNTVQRRILRYENALTTHVNLYYKDIVKREGLFQISADRKVIKPIFKITLQPKEINTYYLQITSNITTLIVDYKLYEFQSFYEKEIKEQNILVFFFSAMLILAIYNLFIYFIVKSISYFYYVFYIITIALHQFFYTGYVSLFIQDSQLVELIIKGASLIVALPILFFALFTVSFINTNENYPKIDKYLTLYLLIYPFILCLMVYFQEQGWIRNIFSVILLVLIFALTIYGAIKQNRQSYFLLLGWFVFFISMTSMYLASVGIYNIYNDIPYLVELFLVLEGVIFSIALADRIKILQKEKDKTQNILIENQKTETVRLGKMVDLKTQELQTALNDKTFLLKELNHRVKNNMQTIISLIRLQKESLEDTNTAEILFTIQTRLNAMNQLHHMLYMENKDLLTIAPTEYFESIVNEIKNSTFSEDIVVKYNIKAYLKSEEAVYCGLIVNELVTNCIKHAFLTNQGVIYINFYKKEGQKTLEIVDNGIGFQQSKEESFGMNLIRSLVEIYLNGKLEMISTNGTKVKIIWS